MTDETKTRKSYFTMGGKSQGNSSGRASHLKSGARGSIPEHSTLRTPPKMKPYFSAKLALVDRFHLNIKRLSFHNARVTARLNGATFITQYALVTKRMVN